MHLQDLFIGMQLPFSNQMELFSIFQEDQATELACQSLTSLQLYYL